MSISVLKSAFNREKPLSSITNLVEIATSPTQAEESYDNLPELVHSIILQGTGPAEASRALRKKIKHGNSHQQYRALFILKALMENTPELKKRYIDDQLIDALKHVASDPSTESRVRKVLNAIAASWNTEFKGDSSIADLYRECRAANRRSQGPSSNSADVDKTLQAAGLYSDSAEQKRREKDEKEAARRKLKRDKAEAKRRAEEEARRSKGRSRRPFNFEADRPQIVTSIANASQASYNLINAMKLVNPEKEKVETNEHVKECLERAKAAGKTIVRYIQQVENEEMIGTLIATNEQVIAAIQMYEALVAAPTPDPTTEIQSGLTAVTLSPDELQDQPRPAEEDDSFGNTGEYAHPDLQDLSFGPLGQEQGALPPPMKPSARRASFSDDDWDHVGRCTLSDLSDYEEEEQPHDHPGPSTSTHKEKMLVHTEDPFADPFAD